MFDTHTLCTSLNFHICSLTGTNDFRRQPCITLPCGQQPTHSQRKRSIWDAYLHHPTENVSSIHLYRSHLGSPIFETLFFVIAIQKHSSKPPVFAPSFVQHQQIQPKRGLSHSPRNPSLWDTPAILIQRMKPSCIRLYISAIGWISLRDIHFCNNYTKTPLKTTHFLLHFCLFITIHFSALPSQRRYSHCSWSRSHSQRFPLVCAPL